MNQRTVFPDAVGVIALRQDNDFGCALRQATASSVRAINGKTKLKFRLASYCI